MDKTAKQLGRRMLAVYRSNEPALQKLASMPEVTCKKGCSSCCFLQVYISIPEAVAMAEHIQKTPNLMAEVLQRCYDQLAKLHPDNTTYFNAANPCVLLNTTTKSCNAYEARPVACRHYYVVSPPENCAPNSEVKTTRQLDTGNLDTVAYGEALRALQQHQLPSLLAPIPVALLWAFRLLAEGETKFVDALRSKEDHGILDIRRWNARAMEMAGTIPERKVVGELPLATE